MGKADRSPSPCAPNCLRFLCCHQEMPSRRWCQRHGLEEQRLYEALKLKRQFESILVENKLVSERQNPSLFQRKRAHPNRDHRGRVILDLDRAAESDYRAKQELMERARRAQSARKRRMLSMDPASATTDQSGTDAADAAAGDGAAGAAASASGSASATAAVDLTALDVRDLDFQLSYDIAALQEDVEAHRKFSKWDINLIKLIVCSGTEQTNLGGGSRSTWAGVRACNIRTQHGRGSGLAGFWQGCTPIWPSPTRATCTACRRSTRSIPRSSAASCCTRRRSLRSSQSSSSHVAPSLVCTPAPRWPDALLGAPQLTDPLPFPRRHCRRQVRATQRCSATCSSLRRANRF